MSSTWGNHFKISIYGESHGVGIGVVIDGVPSGLKLDFDALAAFMKRRAPGRDKTSTPRKEKDIPEILSGVYRGVTTGTPLSALIRNADTHSSDYSEFASVARPGHADYTGFLRYGGCNDIRGGGHFSGRLTAPLTFAGGVAKQFLAQRGILVGAHAFSVADVYDTPFDPVGTDAETLLRPSASAFPVLDEEAGASMCAAIEDARLALDSVGGVVECAVLNMPAGVGSPMFGGLENTISSIIFGIPAVKGVEFGAGFEAAKLRGSQNNDPFAVKNGVIVTESNNAGGILGGISTGMPILLRTAFKPTPSISQPQQTVDFTAHTQGSVTVLGRHDPCVVIRAVPVVEAAVAAAVTDALLAHDGYAPR